MNKFIKTIAAVFLLAICMTTACYADSNEQYGEVIVSGVVASCKEIITNSVSQDTLERYGSSNSEAILLHNNGKKMSVDYIEEGNDTIVAVYRSKINNINYESVYYCNEKFMPKDELMDIIFSNEEETLSNLDGQNIELYSLLEDIFVKNSTWVVTHDGVTEAKITSASTMYRNPDVNNGTTSLWSVKTTTNYEKINAKRLNYLEHKINVNNSGQFISDVAPLQSTSGTTISGTMSKGNYPTVSYNFQIGGFKMTTDHSFSNDYGLWKYNANAGANNDLTIQSVVAATNSSSDFVLSVRNDYSINTSKSKLYTNYGYAQYRMTDR